MKTLMLSAEDIQTFGKLLPHATTATSNSVPKLTNAAHLGSGITTNNNTTTQIGLQPIVNGNGLVALSAATGGINLEDRNLVTLQYYLKHPSSNYHLQQTTTGTGTAAAAAATTPVTQQQQQQQQTQSLLVTQTQLKQLPLKQPTSINQSHQHQHINNYHHHPQHQHHQHHHHPYYQQQQQQQTSHNHHHHQQQQHLLNVNGSTIVPATTVNTITSTTQYNHHQQQQQQQKSAAAAATTTTTVFPVHALNQNSNFSAASSSTGGTASSHAPTQQSNTTGSSFSPPGATANKRTTPASNNNNNNNSNATVSSTTTTTRLNGSGNTSTSGGTKKLKTEPVLSQFHQSERLAFANSHIVWSEEHWKRVVFHDERKFNLDGPDGFSYYFHDLRNYERSLSQRPRGNSVFVYIVISAGGSVHLEVATSKQKPEACIETILRERANIATKLGHGDFMLQDHNWTATSLPTAQEWLSAEGVKLQKWPTIAHDLNIMENVWGWLIREVYDGGRKFSRKDDLIFRIREAWERLPLDLISNLYSTLPERITELYYTRGVYTNC